MYNEIVVHIIDEPLDPEQSISHSWLFILLNFDAVTACTIFKKSVTLQTITAYSINSLSVAAIW
jgi:hypothetical protein